MSKRENVEGFSVDFFNAGGFWTHAVYCNSSRDVVLSNILTNSLGTVKLISQIGAVNSSLRVRNCNPEDGIESIYSDDNSRVITTGCNEEKTN